MDNILSQVLMEPRGVRFPYSRLPGGDRFCVRVLAVLPAPCAMLTLIGVTLLLVTALVEPFLFHYLVRAGHNFGWDNEISGGCCPRMGLLGALSEPRLSASC